MEKSKGKEKSVFTKEQWKKSKLLLGKQDVVEAVLEENKVYTKEEVLTAMQQYLMGKREGK